MLEEVSHSISTTGAAAITEQYIPTRKVLARYSVTTMTLSRWLRNKNFPAPALHLGNRRYWRLREILRWEREQEAHKQAQDAA